MPTAFGTEVDSSEDCIVVVLHECVRIILSQRLIVEIRCQCEFNIFANVLGFVAFHSLDS